tara:strand:+ start:971 stop:1711 length:741 start_codon:yes stop_codon:yes gene_type:complete
MHRIKKYISILFNFFGYEIRKNSSNSSSLKEPFYHFRTLLGNETKPIIFDIGAYIGDTIDLFKSSFPGSYIHAFEPFDESFYSLENRFGKNDEIALNNLAVGDCSEEKTRMYITNNRGSSSLLKPEKGANSFWDGNPLLIEKELKVGTITIDHYCHKNNIEKINILKIDVQGNEIKVLKGAEGMLERKRIKLIFTEISIAPNYKEQSSIDELIRLLKNYQYKIFNFFKMKHQNGRLIECDILFYIE